MTSDQKDHTTTANPAAEDVGQGSSIERETNVAGGAGQSAAATTASEAQKITQLERELWDLDFGIKKSIRYHAKRRALYERLEDLTRVIVAVSGASAFAALMGDPEGTIAKILTGAVAVLALTDIVLGFGRRARDHDRFYHDFSEMAAEIARIEHPTNSDIVQLKARRLILEADEPNIVDALERKCWNEEAEARGVDPQERQKLSNWQRARPGLPF